jgi:Family of unknown function (DUF5709)
MIGAQAEDEVVDEGAVGDLMGPQRGAALREVHPGRVRTPRERGSSGLPTPGAAASDWRRTDPALGDPMRHGGYGTHGDDAQEASLRLEPEDVLEDVSTDDVLETGYSPQDRPWAVDDWGTTAFEEEQGDSLDGRLARELPDVTGDEDEGDDVGDLPGGEGELRDDEVGDERAGRLAETDAGTDSAPEPEPDLEAFDEGIDGGAASAEEAAVHVVPGRGTQS